MVDLITRYVVAVPLPNQFAITICDALMNRFVLINGAPFRLLSDQGANFESSIFTNLCTLWRIQKIRTTAVHPAGNGACERVNRTLKKGFQKLLNEQNLNEWDTVLPMSCLLIILVFTLLRILHPFS